MFWFLSLVSNGYTFKTKLGTLLPKNNMFCMVNQQCNVLGNHLLLFVVLLHFFDV